MPRIRSSWQRHQPVLVRGRPVRLASLVCALLMAGPALHAELPYAQFDSAFPPGGKAGSAFDVSISGENLDDVDQLIFSHAGIKSSQKMRPVDEFLPQSRPLPSTFEVQIASDVPPGAYECRAQGRFGLSNPRAFQVGTKLESHDTKANKNPQSAKVLEPDEVFNGTVDAESFDFFTLNLKRNQQVVINCWARRIDSKLQGVLTLFDANGNEIVRARNNSSGDPLLVFQAPLDGAYRLTLNDFLYGGGTSYFYRIEMHSGPLIDAIFPPAGLPGSNGSYTLFGKNLPNGVPATEFPQRDGPLQKLSVNIALPDDEQSRFQLAPDAHLTWNAGGLDAFAYQLATPQGASNVVPIFYARAPLILEEDLPSGIPAQSVNVPCEFVGNFGPGADSDAIEFSAKAGETYQLSVISQQAGLNTDPVLSIFKVTKNDQGEEVKTTVARIDDNIAKDAKPSDYSLNHADPEVQLAVDADAVYRVEIRNQFSSLQANPAANYRLSVLRESADFRLLLAPRLSKNPQNNNKVEAGPLSLRRGESLALHLTTLRQGGFAGEIEVTVEGLPTGVTCNGANLSPAAESGLLVLTASEQAPRGFSPIRIVGKSTLHQKEVVRLGRVATVLSANPNAPLQTRFMRDVILSVTDQESYPASVQVGDGKILESALGGKLVLPVRLTRLKYDDAIKFTALGLPATIVPGEANFAAKATEGKYEFTFSNALLKPGSYTFCLRGEAKLKVQRNPAELSHLESDKSQIDQVLKTLTEKLQTATAEKMTALKLSQETANKNKALETKRKECADHARQSETNKKQTAEKVTSARQALQGDASNPALKEAAAKADAEDAAADQKRAQSAAELASVEKEVAAAAESAALAEKARAAAEAAAAEIDAKVKRGEQRRVQTNADLDKLKKALADAKETTVSILSPSLRLRIASSPIALAPLENVVVKQGEKVDLSVALQRQFGFDDKVEVLAELPPSIKGLSQKKVDLPKDQSTAKIELSVGKETPVGQYKWNVLARAVWNNVKSEASREVQVKVEPADSK